MPELDVFMRIYLCEEDPECNYNDPLAVANLTYDPKGIILAVEPLGRRPSLTLEQASIFIKGNDSGVDTTEIFGTEDSRCGDFIENIWVDCLIPWEEFAPAVPQAHFGIPYLRSIGVMTKVSIDGEDFYLYGFKPSIPPPGRRQHRRWSKKAGGKASYTKPQYPVKEEEPPEEDEHDDDDDDDEDEHEYDYGEPGYGDSGYSGKGSKKEAKGTKKIEKGAKKEAKKGQRKESKQGHKEAKGQKKAQHREHKEQKKAEHKEHKAEHKEHKKHKEHDDYPPPPPPPPPPAPCQ